MDTSEIKKLIISSLDKGVDAVKVARKLEEEGVSYNFSENFGDKVLTKLFSAGVAIKS